MAGGYLPRQSGDERISTRGSRRSGSLSKSPQIRHRRRVVARNDLLHQLAILRRHERCRSGLAKTQPKLRSKITLACGLLAPSQHGVKWNHLPAIHTATLRENTFAGQAHLLRGIWIQMHPGRAFDAVEIGRTPEVHQKTLLVQLGQPTLRVDITAFGRSADTFELSAGGIFEAGREWSRLKRTRGWSDSLRGQRRCRRRSCHGLRCP